MAFLSKEELAQVKNKPVSAKIHPLLKKGTLPLSVRHSYLQGCVIATLMDDVRMSDAAKARLVELACSLQLSLDDLEEGISVVASIEKGERAAFVAEIVNQVKDPQYAYWFAIDLERMLATSGGISEDGKALMDFVCNALFDREDWRLAAWELERDFCSHEDFKRYIREAEAGDRVAQQVVGQGDLYGKGVGKSIERGLSWLEKSADQGNASAQMELARLYLSGQLVKFDDGKAEAWLRKAVSNGHPDAQYELDQLPAIRKQHQKLEGVAKKEAAKQMVKFKRQLDKHLEHLTCRGILDPLGVIVGIIICVIAWVIVWNWLSGWRLFLCAWVPFVVGLFSGVGAQGIYWLVIQKIYRRIKIAEFEKSVGCKYEEAPE